ncbi:PAS sensor protein [Gemmatirosa kalamazoonensis]|uniref:histidine kinase n=1 Tax=Gemmatirosa kalamazoonensis TaxID=861299 RepID=W0RH98_9BACT|nr:CHASE3 domain-containing protein [Gemmatirosa kalamazoonensis]AHG90499.1 PAS sensor protein [Gemmatirosa kalamazoonensis]
MQGAQRRSESWVRHSREVARGARQAERLAVDRETAVRGFLLTGNALTLAPELAARRALPELLDSLGEMTRDDAGQQRRLAAIRGAIARWDREFAEPALARGAASSPPSTPSTPSQADVRARLAGKPLFDEVRAAFDAFVRAEDAVYATQVRRNSVLRLASGAAILLELMALVLVLVWLRNRVAAQTAGLVAKQQQLEEQAVELEVQTEELREANHTLEQQAVEMELQTTELTAANASLTESQDRYRRLVDSAPYGMLVHRDGQIVFANAAAAHILGFEQADDLLRRDVYGLVHPDDRGQVRDRVRQNLDTGAATPLAELRMLRPDGTTVEVETVGIPLMHDGAPAVQVVLRDASGRKRLEAQFRQAQKMEAVGQLAGGVAHDFNNLLTVIISYSGMLLTELPASDPVRADVQEIRRAAERASALTRQLLAFSRQQLLEPQVLDVNVVVRDLQRMLHRVLREDVRLVTVLAARLGRVYADAGQLEQVIVNLAVNARDAMPTGGTLTVETADVDLDGEYALTHAGVTPGHYVMLAVSDTGVGMDAATQARIFEPFFTTKPLGHGTGLGLATVYGIVKQSGGHVWVYSEPGVGTTFKVYLPRVSAPLTRPRSGPYPAVARGSGTILLVEDDETVRRAARRILEQAGYQVLEARDGAEALRVAGTNGTGAVRVDLVITDVVMPAMSGPEFVAALREARPDVPVIFMSGYTDDAVLRQKLVEPGVAFVQKPFTPEGLARKVGDALSGAPPQVEP